MRPTAPSKGVRCIGAPYYVTARLLQYCVPQTIATTKTTEELVEPLENGPRQDPGRNFSPTPRHERIVENLRRSGPAGRNEHSSYSRPSKTRLYEQAARDSATLGRTQRYCACVCSWEQLDLNAVLRRPYCWRNVKLS